MQKDHPKFFKALFNLTAHDKKIPTDVDLDQKIEQLGFYMHYVWPLLGLIIRKKIWFFFRYKWKNWLKSLIYMGILAACIIIITWKTLLEPHIIIKQVPIEVVNENGMIINTKLITIPAERSELTKDNLDYFAMIFEIKNWYEVRQQIMLECGLTSDICINGHNLFGMKFPGQRETTAIGEYKGHAKYKHWVYSLYDYKLWQTNRMRFMPLMKNETYYKWLVRVRYAEDEAYINKLQTVNWY